MPARLFVERVPPQRIRTFLSLFALALTLPLLALVLFAFNRMASLEEAEIEQRVLQVAGDLAGDVDREIERVTVTLETLATSEMLARGDLAAFYAHASRALTRDKSGILLVDRENKQLLNTKTEFGTALPPTSDPETAQKTFDTKQRQVSNLFVGVVSRQPVINVWVPVLDAKQQVRYVLSMALEATRFEKLLQGQGLDSQWITGITDNQGIILARSERHAEFVGKPLPRELLERSRAGKGVFRAKSVAGANIVRATVRSKVAGWLVSATVPLSYVEAARRRGELFGAAFIVTAMTLGGVLAYMFGGFMARPLDAATEAAEAVGAGKLVQPLKSPLVEANQLTATLSTASAELAARQEHSQFLMRELAHRSKNQLAVVKGMARQTASQSRSVEEFVRQFSQRIQGLAESQDLMVGQNWQGAWLGDLVRAHIDLFGAGGRVEVQGPALFLNANAVQNIGFALHELATNASKHGALGSPEGRVLVNWRRSEGGRIRLEWIEMGGSTVTPPQRRGFGSLVVTELVAQSLDGTAKLDFLPSGVHWQLDMPATHVLTTPAATATSA